MNPVIRREMQHLAANLSKTSWTSYRKLIDRLCQEHSSFQFVRPIRNFLADNDIKNLVDYADSLALQLYKSPYEHFVANQFSLLIKKYPFPSDLNPFDPEKEARVKFHKSEIKCSQMNDCFRNINVGESPLGEFYYPFCSEHLLDRMRSYIRYVLGDAPDLENVFNECDFGPGASIGTHGDATNQARKLSGGWSVSPGAVAHAHAAVARHAQMVELLLSDHESLPFYCLDNEEFTKRFEKRCVFVPYNKLAFVPKNVKTFRSIAIEPLLNGFIQKGIDIVMRKKLSRVGIDLSDQANNSSMARKGSLDDSEDGFCTIDLAAASDSIAIEVVKNLLPPDWYNLLNCARSKYYWSEETKVTSEYNKFCSMGNGFCFPLETLIFAAACHAVGCGESPLDFSVYGDDIIVRQRYFDQVVDLLGHLGFSVNTDKTYRSGPFRESCGGDWFAGVDVRPFTFDFRLDSLESLFKFLNLTQRNAFTKGFFEESLPFIKGMIPKRLQFMRPLSGNADSGYTVEKDEFFTSPYARWSKDLQCWSWVELQFDAICDKHWRRLLGADTLHVMAALRGSSSDKPYTFRRKTRITLRRKAFG